jgi:hypothetical protein
VQDHRIGHLTYPPPPPWLDGDMLNIPLRWRAAATEGTRRMSAVVDKFYLVKMPYMNLKVATPDGVMYRGFFDGAVVTGLMDEEGTGRLVEAGMLEEVRDPGAAVLGPDTEVHVRDTGEGQSQADADIDHGPAGPPKTEPAEPPKTSGTRSRAGGGKP